MSARLGAIAGIAWFGLAGVASGQQQASSFFTGVPSTQINNVAVDTSKSVVPSQGSSALFNRFNFSALFSRSTIPSPTPTRGVSPLPPPSAFPSTSYQPFKMVGNPPFLIKWMFGSSDKSPIQPARPFTPSNPTPVGPGSS
ncbi:MAG: hypothetical protein ACJ8C4_02430 [Gemmataceae bacterium]